VSRAKDAETAAKESAAKAAAILEKEVVAPPLSRKALTVLLRYIAGQVDKLPEGIVAMTPGYKENVRGVGRASKAATTMGSDTATVAATFAVTAQGTATSTWGSIAQVRFVEKASLLCSFFIFLRKHTSSARALTLSLSSLFLTTTQDLAAEYPPTHQLHVHHSQGLQRRIVKSRKDELKKSASEKKPIRLFSPLKLHVLD
jgi:hypothetical protein